MSCSRSKLMKSPSENWLPWSVLKIFGAPYLARASCTASMQTWAAIARANPLTMVAGIGQWGLGKFDLGLLASLLVGSIPGINLGSRLSIKVDHGIVRRATAVVLAVVLALVGVKLLLQD